MAKRTYESETLRVLWDSEKCIHAGYCVRMGGGAFDTNRRPWVDLAVADAETVVESIEMCPSGALRYERLDGQPGEAVPTQATIVPLPNGPLAIRGEFTVMDRHGGMFTSGPRATLCRCGASANAPLCDNSHRKIGFRSYPRSDDSPDD